MTSPERVAAARANAIRNLAAHMRELAHGDTTCLGYEEMARRHIDPLLNQVHAQTGAHERRNEA